MPRWNCATRAPEGSCRAEEKWGVATLRSVKKSRPSNGRPRQLREEDTAATAERGGRGRDSWERRTRPRENFTFDLVQPCNSSNTRATAPSSSRRFKTNCCLPCCWREYNSRDADNAVRRICSQMHRFRSSSSSSSNVTLDLLLSSRRDSKRAAGCFRLRRSRFCLSGSSLVSSWLIKREERHGSLFSSPLLVLRRNDGSRRTSTCFTSLWRIYSSRTSISCYQVLRRWQN